MYLAEFDDISAAPGLFPELHYLIRLGEYAEAWERLGGLDEPVYNEHLGYFEYLKGLLNFLGGQMSESYSNHRTAHNYFERIENREWLAKNAASWFQLKRHEFDR